MINYTKPGSLHVIVNKRQIYLTLRMRPLSSFVTRYHFNYVFGQGRVGDLAYDIGGGW